MYKIVKISLIVIGLLAAVLWFMLPSSDVPAAEAVNNGALNGMFWITYVLFAVAILFSLVYSLIHTFSNPAGLKRSLMYLGGFLGIMVISYVFASGTDVSISEMASRGVTTDETTIKRIGMGLNMFFILTIIAVVLMILPSIKKMFSK